jgi:antitoxin ParD1/3/4
MARQVPLDPELQDFVDRLVASGEYEDASDVVRAGLELLRDQEDGLERRRAELYARIDEGLGDARAGRTVPAEEVFAKLRHMLTEKQAERDAAE